ncbi:hypothetical protein IOCL2690_000432000 [Leishmania lindenbergi]|uniref:Uncharacterized protein n=1 Tax=Leishmania lindenbergi TaxID=651832 RepID=A0AAW3AFG5_9TRYP
MKYNDDDALRGKQTITETSLARVSAWLSLIFRTARSAIVAVLCIRLNDYVNAMRSDDGSCYLTGKACVILTSALDYAMMLLFLSMLV